MDEIDRGRTHTPSAAELRSRRSRNIAIGLAIGLLVVLFYVVTIAKFTSSLPVAHP